jgi:hypothetical protein
MTTFVKLMQHRSRTPHEFTEQTRPHTSRPTHFRLHVFRGLAPREEQIEEQADGNSLLELGTDSEI